MKITKEHLKSWGVPVNGYRWFLNKFPNGGDYVCIKLEMLSDGRFADAHWLTENVYQAFFKTPELPLAEASAGDKMIEALNNMVTPTIESSSDWTCQASSDCGAISFTRSHGVQQASSGDWTCQASSGEGTRQAASGEGTDQVSSSDRTHQASSGNWTKQTSSGDYIKQASSGNRTRQASSGSWVNQASSGNWAKHFSTGAFSKVAVSGLVAEITATGDNAVVVAAGSVRKIVLGAGGCASVAYNDGNRTRFAVAYVGESGIEAGVTYTVNDNGEFVELGEK